MNVGYRDLNMQDASKMIGIDYSTLAYWCRNNRINCINIGDGTKKGRYMLSEEEVLFLKHLKEKFGTRKILMYYRKDWKAGHEPAANEEVQDMPMIKSTVIDISTDESKEIHVTSIKPKLDEVMATISYIQDIKARIADIENEKAQLMKELEDLRKEVMTYL